MKKSFDQMPEDARLWIYQCNRKFSSAEIEGINSSLQEFLASWDAHGIAIKSSYRLYYDQVNIRSADDFKPPILTFYKYIGNKGILNLIHQLMHFCMLLCLSCSNFSGLC